VSQLADLLRVLTLRLDLLARTRPSGAFAICDCCAGQKQQHFCQTEGA
jgi:hypothetical protein